MPSYDIEDPPEPLPGWFRALLMGPASQHHTFRKEITRLDDWSTLVEIKHHCTITDELRETRRQLGILDTQINDLVEKRRCCEACLEARKVPAQVKYLEHLAPPAPQIVKCRGFPADGFQDGQGCPT